MESTEEQAENAAQVIPMPAREAQHTVALEADEALASLSVLDGGLSADALQGGALRGLLDGMMIGLIALAVWAGVAFGGLALTVTLGHLSDSLGLVWSMAVALGMVGVYASAKRVHRAWAARREKRASERDQTARFDTVHQLLVRLRPHIASDGRVVFAWGAGRTTVTVPLRDGGLARLVLRRGVDGHEQLDVRLRVLGALPSAEDRAWEGAGGRKAELTVTRKARISTLDAALIPLTSDDPQETRSATEIAARVADDLAWLVERRAWRSERPMELPLVVRDEPLWRLESNAPVQAAPLDLERASTLTSRWVSQQARDRWVGMWSRLWRRRLGFGAVCASGALAWLGIGAAGVSAWSSWGDPLMTLWGWASVVAVVVSAAVWVELGLRDAPPRVRLRPRRGQMLEPDAQVLRLERGRLSVGNQGGGVVLREPFRVNLTREPDPTGGPDRLGVALRQRAPDAAHGIRHVRFMVPVALADDGSGAMERLVTDAPRLDPDAFTAWLWPTLRAYASLHGDRLPGLMRAHERAAPVVMRPELGEVQRLETRVAVQVKR